MNKTAATTPPTCIRSGISPPFIQVDIVAGYARIHLERLLKKFYFNAVIEEKAIVLRMIQGEVTQHNAAAVGEGGEMDPDFPADGQGADEELMIDPIVPAGGQGGDEDVVDPPVGLMGHASLKWGRDEHINWSSPGRLPTHYSMHVV